MLVKLSRIAVLVVVVVVIFRRHASDKFQEAILEAEPGDFSCIAYLSSMLFLTIFGEVMYQLIKIKCVFILIQFANGTDVKHLFLRLSFFGLYIYVRYLKTVPSG